MYTSRRQTSSKVAIYAQLNRLPLSIHLAFFGSYLQALTWPFHLLFLGPIDNILSYLWEHLTLLWLFWVQEISSLLYPWSIEYHIAFWAFQILAFDPTHLSTWWHTIVAWSIRCSLAVGSRAYLSVPWSVLADILPQLTSPSDLALAQNFPSQAHLFFVPCFLSHSLMFYTCRLKVQVSCCMWKFYHPTSVT